MRLISRVASSEWPPSSKKLSSMPTRSRPSTSANSAHRISSCGVRGARRTAVRRQLGSRQRLAVELAVRRQRKPLQHHERRRHHVVRKAATKMRSQRPQGPRVSTGSRNHIGNQPLVARHVLARNHRRLRTRSDAAPAPLRSPQARCGTRAPSPGCPHGPESPKPRPHASAPSPRCGTSGSPQDQTDPQQTAPPSAPHDPDSPAQDPHPQCKAPPSHQPVQAPSPRPIHKPACSISVDQSATLPSHPQRSP